MQLPIWWHFNRGLLFLRPCHKSGGQWTTARRAYVQLHYCGLVALSIYPHYRHSTGSRLLGSNSSNAFSTSAVAKKARVRPALSTRAGATGVSQATRANLAAEEVREMEEFLRPKEKLRMVGSPETKSESNVTTSNVASPLNEAWKKHNELTRMFYQKVEEENNIFWIESKKLDKVPTSIMAKWHYTPRSHRVGLMRLHGTISHVTAYVEDQKLRQQLTDWDANSCEHLAPFFKEILEMRANLAKSYGFNNYMDYQAQYKLLDRRSAENFLNQLKRHFLPRIASHTNELFKMKLRDMGYHLTFETLRDNLKYYNHTILDFQDEHPKYRLDVGEVARYTWLKRKKNGSLDSFKYMEYFPLQSTARRLLDVIPPVFGLKFEELLLDGKDYTNVMTDYLKSGQSSSTISDKEEKLLIFAVKDSRFPKIGYPMGYVVLDLLRRPGKVQNGHCRRFGNYSLTFASGRKVGKSIPGLAILTSVPKPTTNKKPSFLSHSDLETLAHELGHAIHHFVRGDFVGVPWDSIEIPSLLAEKWVVDPRILQKLSSHYIYEDEAYLRAWKSENPSESSLPPQKAPLDTFDQVILNKHPGNNVTTYQYLLWKAKFDVKVHSYSAEQLKDANIGHDCGNILGEWAGIFGDGPKPKGPKDIGPNRMESTRKESIRDILSQWIGDFSNGWSNKVDRNNNTYLNRTELQGYGTSYYCYLYARVYTVDIFNTFFARDPLNRKQGMRFRRIFLEHRDYFPSCKAALRFKYNPLKRLYLCLKLKLQGHSENTMDALEKFMGRKLSMKPFLKTFKAPMKKEANRGFRMRLKMIWESIWSIVAKGKRRSPSPERSD